MSTQAPISRPALTSGSDYTRPLRLLGRLLSFAWLVIGFGLVGWGLFGLISELQHKAPLAMITVEGDISTVDRDELAKRLKPVVQGSYFSTDLVVIRDAVLASPWVESMSVQRRWPDGLRVFVVEKKAVARWGQEGFVSARGEVFHPKVNYVAKDLPLLFGPVGKTAYVMEQYRAFNDRFRVLNLRVIELHLTERRTWFIKFDSGLQLILDQSQINEKLQRFLTLYGRELSPYAERIASIDLRYRNGLAVAWKEGQAVPVSNNQLQKLQ
jgi:cell division protein FtsQ